MKTSDERSRTKNTMSDPFKNAYKAKAKPKRKSNGTKRKNSSDPLPGLNINELIEERNWTALVGLGLIGVGLVYVVFHVLNISFALWAWLMVAGGAWLTYDAWQDYDAAGRIWAGKTRNRMIAGVLIVLVGLFNALRIPWGGLLLLGAGGWLAYDTWQKYDAVGRTWTQQTRNRMFVAGALILFGLLSFIPSWSTWPLLIIVIGVVMLYRHSRRV
jgi:hypothetical protein